MTISSRQGALVALLAAGFVLGGCSAVFGDRQSNGPRKPPVAMLSDEQSREQVVSAAASIAKEARLREVYGGFSFGSCNDQGEPPYKGIVEMSFAVPIDVEPKSYLEQIAETMVGNGWLDGPPPGKKPFGVVIHLHGVMAVMTVGPNPRWAKAQVHGECGNVTDHRTDGKTNWVDVTDRLTGS